MPGPIMCWPGGRARARMCASVRVVGFIKIGPNSTESDPNLGEDGLTPAKPCRIRAKLAEIGPNWPKMAEFEPNLADVGPKSGNSGPMLAEFGRSRPNLVKFGRFRGKIWLCPSQSWSNSVGAGSNSVGIGRMGSESGEQRPPWSDVRRIPPTCWSSLGKVWSNLADSARNRPTSARIWPLPGQRARYEFAPK